VQANSVERRLGDPRVEAGDGDVVQGKVRRVQLTCVGRSPGCEAHL